MRASLISKTLVIPANGSIPYDQAGDLFVVKEAEAAFDLSMDGKDHFNIELGFTVKLDPIYGPGGVLDQVQSFFRRLVFKNTTATDINVTFYIGIGVGVDDNRLNTLVGRTLNIGATEPETRIISGGSNLAAAATDTFVGTNAGNRRKHIILTNKDSDNDLDILDVNGTQCGVLMPRETLPIATSATIKVRNSSGAAVQYYAMEIYYTKV